jgi:hypothetical protein
MLTYKHKHCKGLTVEIIGETNKGYKVRQTELFKPWSNTKLRKPKVKTAYYSLAEFSELFEENI